jgi:hypothetical protein
MYAVSFIIRGEVVKDLISSNPLWQVVGYEHEGGFASLQELVMNCPRFTIPMTVSGQPGVLHMGTSAVQDSQPAYTPQAGQPAYTPQAGQPAYVPQAPLQGNAGGNTDNVALVIQNVTQTAQQALQQLKAAEARIFSEADPLMKDQLRQFALALRQAAQACILAVKTYQANPTPQNLESARAAQAHAETMMSQLRQN